MKKIHIKFEKQYQPSLGQRSVPNTIIYQEGSLYCSPKKKKKGHIKRAGKFTKESGKSKEKNQKIFYFPHARNTVQKNFKTLISKSLSRSDQLSFY